MREDEEEEGREELRTAREEGREIRVLREGVESVIEGRNARGNRIGMSKWLVASRKSANFQHSLQSLSFF